MTPTLLGRIQTRLAVVLSVGLLWTLVVTPLLPRQGATLEDAYTVTISAVLIVAFVGAVVWEPLYHFAQQFRWEKDWPTGLGLVLGLPEAILTYALLVDSLDVPGPAFVLHFATTWTIVWVTVHGPLRILLLRWRYRGGRLV